MRTNPKATSSIPELRSVIVPGSGMGAAVTTIEAEYEFVTEPPGAKNPASTVW